MENESGAAQRPIIADIRKNIRQLQAIAAFIFITLFAVILRYLYKPVSDRVAFIPEVSITLILIIILVLTSIGFYLLRTVSRRILTNIGKYSTQLDNILTMTRDVREEVHIDILYEKIIDYSLSLTGSDAGSILLLDGDNLVFQVVRGEKAIDLLGTMRPKDRGIAGWVAEHSSPLLIDNAGAEPRFDQEVDSITDTLPGSLLCVPLSTKTGVIGVIELLSRKEGFYTAKDEEIISYLADQAAVSIAGARFVEDQKNYEIHLTDILLEAIDYQIPEKVGHSKRVAMYSNIIANAIHLSEERKKRLYFAGLLHDVGFLKIKGDESFVRQEYQKHSVIGYEMIKPINFYSDISPFILYHHEKYDGTGYPSGLSGEDIPLEARIIAIAEAFDAMVSSTSYKIPLDFDSAIQELKRNAGSQFDFWLVDVFVANISAEQLP